MPATHNSFSPPPFSQTFASQSSSEVNTPRSLARKMLYRDQDDSSKPSSSSSSQASDSSRGLAPPPRTSSMNAKMSYASHSELYTQNDLNTYSFGAAASSSSPSLTEQLVDPLSRPRDEQDSDDLASIPDTTPRPSVVAVTHNPRSHQSQYPDFHHSRTRSSSRAKERDSDLASNSTFPNSSASASVSSLSRPSESNHSRATSRSRRSTTPLTSANDLTSDEDELESDGRHPIPSDFQDLEGPSPHRRRPQTSSLYLSEEDFPDSEQDSESDDHHHPNPLHSQYSGRRGSHAIPIPNTQSDSLYQDNRARENSLATIRRPSKSLEDLHSFSFAQSSGASAPPRADSHHPLSIAPNSVPQSESDWREYRKRSMQRDMLPPVPPQIITSIPGPSSSSISQSASTSYHSSSSATASSTVVESYDFSWMQYGTKGVVAIDDVADIVGESGPGSRSAFYPFRKASAGSRRASTISSNVDIIHKNIAGAWASQKAKDQRHMWLFVKEKNKPSGDDDKGHGHGFVTERERPSISSLFRPNTSGDGSGIHGAVTFFPEPKDRERSSGKEKEKASGKDKPVWKGMPLDAEEMWGNGALGKYKVVRKNVPAIEAGKAPQQRLNISYFRNTAYYPNGTSQASEGPTVTIHKHSKAGAFSISRHYRTKPAHHDNASSSSHALKSIPSRNNLSSRESTDASRKKTSMILLAPRRVQKAYTSTNTTRKLDTHGLLDDNGNGSAREQERRRDYERERERERDKGGREKGKEKEKKGKEKDKEKAQETISLAKSESKVVVVTAPDTVQLDNSEDSSAGSVGNTAATNPSTSTSTSAVTTPECSDTGGNSFGSIGSIEQSIMSHETASSDKTISRNNYPYKSQQRKRDPYDILDDSDSDGPRPRYPTKTPHRETYAALPPEVFETTHQQNPSTGLFGWGKSKHADRNALRANPFFEQSYNPPWPVTAPRSNQETRKGIVDDLNMSFQDVGLLPAMNEIKPYGHGSQHRKRREKAHAPRTETRVSDNKSDVDIFEAIHPDALYMLLPLWPGETDPYSARKHPFTPPKMPMEDKPYLLIYYRAQSEPMSTVDETSSKIKSQEKKKSKNSPTSSHDSMHKKDERSVFMKQFHISARMIHYRDLQGTGVRIPDQGLAVSGSLQEAYEYVPVCNCSDHYVIGISHSRDGGIEFFPEGFEKLGLARSIPNPRPVEFPEEDDSSSMDTIFILTPIGRAVMEMAWLGGMAVTSFSSSSS
ncbi:hypothetical protein CVT24_003340 [Panaeolus cyanescens]|uniref:Uncharacterized protein n=1 Tax=Panaeolus cyanescens TaxID=181874 RepID=A0A409Y6V7_9AGAR|nr:hypothetical protein CVT24_003340 [Panaeolus cyanescens]